MASVFKFFAPSQRYSIIEKDTLTAGEEEAGHMLSPSSSENGEYLPRYTLPKRTTSSYSPFLVFLRYIVFTTLLVLGASVLIIAGIKQLFFTVPSYVPTIATTTPMMTSEILTYEPPMVSPCGNSVAEAKAAGCYFDNIAFAWLPERCWDEDLSKSFRDTKFEFFLGPNRTDQVPQDSAFTGVYPHLYVNWEYHVLHCTYMWRKLHRTILMKKGPASVDGIARDYTHTEHCETMLLRRQEVPYDDVNTIVSVKYPDCGAH